jgi:hypothetical protein
VRHEVAVVRLEGAADRGQTTGDVSQSPERPEGRTVPQATRRGDLELATQRGDQRLCADHSDAAASTMA